MREILKVPMIVLPNVVFFPNTSLPLYVADEKFEKLIQSAIQYNQYVGVSLEKDNIILDEDFNGHNIFSVGKPIIVERMTNGILKILLKGVHRVRVLSINSYEPFLEATCETLRDEYYRSDVKFEHKLSSLNAILEEWLNNTISNLDEREQFQQTINTQKSTIDYISTFLIQDKIIRQILLENTNLKERVELLSLMLTYSFPFYEKVEVCEALKSFENLENIARWAN